MSGRHNYPTNFGFDPNADPRALITPDLVGFIEEHGRFIKGTLSGQPIRLLPWQRRLLRDLQRARKRPVGPVVALVGVGRKNGKSLLGAGVALHGLIGEGEEGAEVYSCAGTKKQARIVFDAAKRMVQLSSALSRVIKPYRDVLEVPATGSTYQAVSAEAFSKEGYNPSVVVFDEVHVQPNAELWDVMRLGMGTREHPLLFGITTAGALFNVRGEPSFCHQLYLYGKQVKSGEIADPSFFFRWWEPADPDADHRDPKTWVQANPSMRGIRTLRADLASAVKQTRPQEFKTKRCNLWVPSKQTWLPPGAWEACEDPIRLMDGPVVLGFDGSWSNDSTVLLGCTVERRPHLFVIEAWEKPPGQDDWRVPIEDVEDAIRTACRNHTVTEVAADPYRWSRSLQRLEIDHGLPIVEFPTNSLERMVPATKRFEDAVMDRFLTHDGNHTLARHVANAKAKVTTKGLVITKDHKASPMKIDGAIAALIAHDRASQLVPADPVPQVFFG